MLTSLLTMWLTKSTKPFLFTNQNIFENYNNIDNFKTPDKFNYGKKKTSKCFRNFK